MQNRWNPKLLTAAFVGTFFALTAAPAWCDDHQASHEAEHREEHDEARYLVNRGNIRPLPEVLRAVQSHVSGEIMDLRHFPCRRPTRSQRHILGLAIRCAVARSAKELRSLRSGGVAHAPLIYRRPSGLRF
jgi:hypothetical protein